MAKTVTFGAKPTRSTDPEDWVQNTAPQNGTGDDAPTLPDSDSPKRMKRLTIDIPEALHRRIKVGCAMRGTQIADEVRSLLETHYSIEEQ